MGLHHHEPTVPSLPLHSLPHDHITIHSFIHSFMFIHYVNMEMESHKSALSFKCNGCCITKSEFSWYIHTVKPCLIISTKLQ